MGGLGPAPLRPGDRLSTVDSLALPRRLDPAVLPDRGGIVRVVPGPRDDWFTAASRREFFGKPYTAAPDSDRAGVRLTGPRLIRAISGELPTEGMVTGAVQVPPSGEPIVLLAGHGPTGGYPVIGVVIRADLPTVGQLLPGRGIRFTPVTVERARAAYRDLRESLDRAIS
jgi:allophanate hydrolase subunit 2